jgi:hypothetical protein
MLIKMMLRVKKTFYGMQMNISHILFGQNILEFWGGVGPKVPHILKVAFSVLPQIFLNVFHRKFEQLRVYFRTVVKES